MPAPATLATSAYRLCGRDRVLAFALALLLSAVAARAGDKHDHDRARAAVQAGEVLPLPTLLERLQRSHPGQVLEVELERSDGRWIYEVKLVQAGGQLLKLKVDARTAQLLELERKDRRADDRGSRRDDRGR